MLTIFLIHYRVLNIRSLLIDFASFRPHNAPSSKSEALLKHFPKSLSLAQVGDRNMSWGICGHPSMNIIGLTLVSWANFGFDVLLVRTIAQRNGKRSSSPHRMNTEKRVSICKDFIGCKFSYWSYISPAYCWRLKAHGTHKLWYHKSKS